MAALLEAGEQPKGAVAFPPATVARCEDVAGLSVVYVQPAATSGFNHQLVLHDAKGAIDRPILGFDRHVDVLWAPECRVLAVTNWDSSDGSQVFVLVPPSVAPVADIRSLVLQQHGPLPSITENHHVYFEALRWLGRGTLRVRASGYGEVDPGGFEVFFDCDLDGTVRHATGT